MTKIVSIAVVFSITNGVATAAWAGKDVIKISAVTPYNDPTIIATNIVEECTQLGGKLANSGEVFRWQTDEFEVRPTREERLEVRRLIEDGSSFEQAAAKFVAEATEVIVVDQLTDYAHRILNPKRRARCSSNTYTQCCASDYETAGDR